MFIVLDLETTGLSPKDDSIIELAFIKIDRENFQEIDRFTYFVNPEKEIPDIITQITGISDKDVENAPKFQNIADDVQDFIEGWPLIGHNIPFDVRFLESHGIDTSKNPKIDTFFLANFLCYDQKSLNLGYLCESFGIELESAHRAIDDTLATVQLFKKLIGLMQDAAKMQGEALYHFFSSCTDAGVKILRDEYLGQYKHSKSLDEIGEQYQKELKKNKTKIPSLSSTEDTPNIHEFLDNIQDFELRESQKYMIDKVDNSLSKGTRILIEAPTGIGKTFAYLLPAIKHSLSFAEQVHISTSTKALQDQIFYKDLQFLSKNFPESFSFTKLKGRRNYLSIMQFFEFISEARQYSSAEISFILKLWLWSLETEYGELDELDYYGEEYSLLSDIHAGNSMVMSESNPYQSLEFIIHARRRAKSSNIVITNNHILFQDAVSDNMILGDMKNLIIDEAHSLEDIVTQSLKKTLSYEGIIKIFQKIDKKLQKHKFSYENYESLKQQTLFSSAELFSHLEGKIFEKFSLGAKYKILLLEEKHLTESSELQICAKNIYKDIKTLHQYILEGEAHKKYLSSEQSSLEYLIESLELVFLHTNSSKYIYYISHDEQRGTQLTYTVLSPGDFLSQNVWSQLESVVLTSATLQMNGSFQYIDRVLQTENFQHEILKSSFDYEKQALIFIPNDLGSIKNNIENITTFLGEFFTKVRGNTLVLFTAFSLIREIYSKLKLDLQKDGVSLLAQSISGSKHKQIEHFKKYSASSILMGTDSFWEGIDIPGDDLKYLLIHKIPFPVPSDPIFIARSQLYKNSFEEYAIPKSIIKLKQGFGRLIRSEQDTGMMIFLDDRIFSTSWGKIFLDAFPSDIKVRYGSSQKLIEILPNVDK